MKMPTRPTCTAHPESGRETNGETVIDTADKNRRTCGANHSYDKYEKRYPNSRYLHANVNMGLKQWREDGGTETWGMCVPKQRREAESNDTQRCSAQTREGIIAGQRAAFGSKFSNSAPNSVRGKSDGEGDGKRAKDRVTRKRQFFARNSTKSR